MFDAAPPPIDACLPGLGPFDRLCGWIEQRETLLWSALLVNPEGDAHGARVCAIVLSRDVRGEFHVRLCAGHDDRLMIWREQRTVAPTYGRRYAEGITQAWAKSCERAGYALAWSQRRSIDLAA